MGPLNLIRAAEASITLVCSYDTQESIMGQTLNEETSTRTSTVCIFINVTVHHLRSRSLEIQVE